MKNPKPLNLLLAKMKNKRRIAEILSVSPQAIDGWFKRGQIPINRVLELESKTGISRHDLRPDIYPLKAA